MKRDSNDCNQTGTQSDHTEVSAQCSHMLELRSSHGKSRNMVRIDCKILVSFLLIAVILLCWTNTFVTFDVPE